MKIKVKCGIPGKGKKAIETELKLEAAMPAAASAKKKDKNNYIVNYLPATPKVEATLIGIIAKAYEEEREKLFKEALANLDKQMSAKFDWWESEKAL